MTVYAFRTVSGRTPASSWSYIGPLTDEELEETKALAGQLTMVVEFKSEEEFDNYMNHLEERES